MVLSTNAEYGAYLSPMYQSPDKNRRGINVYHMSEIQNVSGRSKEGKVINAEYQLPLFILTPNERECIARLNSDILGLVIGRMNKISSLQWNIVRKKKEEDREAEKLRAFKQIYDEYKDATLQDAIIRQRCVMNIKSELPDVKPDLSNFDNSLRRWRKRIKYTIEDSSQKIIDWLNSANLEDDFEEFQKKWVFDLMIHGSEAIYKKYINGALEDFYLLPGGSVFPLRSKYVGAQTGYVQMLAGYMPQIYFSNELLFDSYVPISARSYGLIPIEALINKISESLLFDKLAAERADGTKPPEKLVILGSNNNMFGDIGDAGFNVPINQEEQKRIETIVNEERKNAIRVISGHGTPVIADISKADTFESQSNRQTSLKKDIALVFSATPMEMGLAGSDDTSGRSTSETQERIERERGVFPIVRIIDKTITAKIIPYKFGSGWKLEHKTGLTEAEQIKLDSMMLTSGSYDINAIRETRGDEPYPEEIYDRPLGISQDNQSAGQNEMSPLYIREAN